MDDYISREAAIESLEFCAELCRAAIDSLVCDPKNQEIRLDQIEDDIDTIKNEPAADVRENVRGEWKRTVTGHPYCSSCNWFPEENEMTGFFYDFCPNCGADMRGEK